MSNIEPHYALGTFSIAGCTPFAGLIVNDQVVAVSALNGFSAELGGKIYGADSVKTIIESWDVNLPVIRNGARALREKTLGEKFANLVVPMSSLKVHAPLENPGQIFMSRANYRKHVIDLGFVMGLGEGDTEEERKISVANMIDKIAEEGEPYFFTKLLSSVTGPFDEIEVAATTEMADWELELAVVIGRPARNVTYDNAMDYVAGYCMANDLSNRDLLKRDDLGPGQDWMFCKCSPGYMPMGPYLVPKDAVADPHDLSLQLKHNDIVRQDEVTNDLVHNIPKLIETLSRHVQLLPGDIISTGSPAGNGMQIGVFIRPGDVIESTITGLGTMKNSFIEPR